MKKINKILKKKRIKNTMGIFFIINVFNNGLMNKSIARFASKFLDKFKIDLFNK